MTLVYKEVAWEHPLLSNDKTLLLAADGRTHKILMHQKYKPKSKETSVSLPLVCIFVSTKCYNLYNIHLFSKGS